MVCCVSFNINEYELVETRDTFINTLMSVFSENTKYITEFEYLDKICNGVVYKMKSKEYSERLKIMGFTLANARNNFKKMIQETHNLDCLDSDCDVQIVTNVLKELGGYLPIEWKGYNKKLNRYQGVIMEKDKVKNAFIEKIENKDFDKGKFDFSGIDSILNTIFDAFND